MKSWVVLSFFTAIFLSGCSSMKKQYHDKFENKTVVSTSRFADSTVAMLSNLNLQFSPDDTVLVRRFVDHTAAPEIQAKALHDDMLEGISAIVWYSVELVDINETGKDEAERVAMYGKYMERFKGRLLEKGRCDEALFNKTIENVLKQETLLAALRTAQPLLNTLISDGALQIGDLIDSVKVLSAAIDARIEVDYAKIVHYRKTLEREKFDILEAYELVYEAYRSPSPELSKLRDSGVIWEPAIIPEGKPTVDDVEAIAEHLSKRMAALRAVQQEIEPDWNEYKAAHAELDRLAQNIIADAHRTRVLMLTWIRAHQSLTQGTTEAAEWFDITELGTDLIKSAPSAIIP